MRVRQEDLPAPTARIIGIRSAMRIGPVLLAIMSHNVAVRAQESGGTAPNSGAQGLPPPNYPTSPHRGVIDGWTGKPIPCRCRFEGKQLELGTVVCMNTHIGTVLTRCDIIGNNTSWIPSREPCTPKVGS